MYFYQKPNMLYTLKNTVSLTCNETYTPVAEQTVPQSSGICDFPWKFQRLRREGNSQKET